jgi:hypothetical protein
MKKVGSLKGLSLRKSTNGFILPYVLMILIFLFGFVLSLHSILMNELKVYEIKEDYHYLAVLENRAINHARETIEQNLAYDFKVETRQQTDGYTTYRYYLFSNYYRISIYTKYKTITRTIFMYVDLVTHEIRIQRG